VPPDQLQPPPSERILMAAESSAGLVRAANQDSVFVGPTKRGALALVADGMGGHVSGELASRKARGALVRALGKSRHHPPLALAQAVQRANLDIYDHAAVHPENRGMGTTLTLVLVDDQLALIGHVGDSRAYLIRGGAITQLTHDHSWVADRVRQGLLSESEAKQHGWRNVITNVLGTGPQVRLELSALTLQAGDRLLVCSDGLTLLLPDALILQIAQRGPPAEVVAELLRRADERGSPDNVTAALLLVTEVEARPKAYALPSETPVSVTLGDGAAGLSEVEAAFPYRGRAAWLRRHPLYPYRFWLLGCLGLLLLFLLFTLP
jgi:serine/threonine protein phosphatase PrpC